MDLSDQTFIRAIELESGRVILMTQDPYINIEEQPHTGFCYWTEDEGWVEIGIGSKLTVDACLNETATAAISMDETGFMHEVDGENVQRTFLTDESQQIPTSAMRSVKRVGDQLFAVGVERQAYMRSVGSPWSIISPSDLMTPPQPAAFEAVDGFSNSEIYTAGWDGEIWNYNGHQWRQIESPTNVVLNDICCGTEMSVAVGLIGQVIIGRGQDWKMVANDATKDAFWSVCEFNGVFYLSALSGIYKIENDEVVLARGLDDDMRTAFQLFVGPRGLWTIGTNDLTVFDGTDWFTIAQS